MITVSSHVDVATPSGPMRVHLHQPSGDGEAPGLVLFSEIYQQTGPIRRAAIRFASRGYVVAVPEVFHEHEPPGTVLAYDAEGTEKGNRYKASTALATYDADARAAVDLLRAQPRVTCGIGAVGWCLGGHLALRAALSRQVLATACFYPTDIHGDTLGAGQASDSKSRLADVKGELMMLFGRQDPHVPEDGRRVIREALSAAGVVFSWHEVNAVHAFMRDEGPRYDAALAEVGYALALEMFDRVLHPRRRDAPR